MVFTLVSELQDKLGDILEGLKKEEEEEMKRKEEELKREEEVIIETKARLCKLVNNITLSLLPSPTG